MPNIFGAKITANGTTSLATKGKFCEEDVDVIVAVESGGEKPTEFVNLAKTALLKAGYYGSTNGFVALSRNTSIGIPIPSGTFQLRIRGVYYFHTAEDTFFFGTSDNTQAVATRFFQNFSVDEHGDWMYTLSNTAGYTHIWIPYVTSYIVFNRGNLIITINEPIGNGGYVATNDDNLFQKSAPDVVLTGRTNSSGAVVSYLEGQLVTGWIEGKLGDTFNVQSDKANNANNYVGCLACYNANKEFIGQLYTNNVSPTAWKWDSGYLNGSVTIPAEDRNINYSATAYVRLCVAYTDIDSIVITKA